MFRKIIFWSHLAMGLVGGVFIAIMSFTGAALAFEREIVAWAERDARQVAAPAAGAPRLSLEEVLRRVQSAKPDARITNVGLSAEPNAAIALGLPNNATLYVNPYTAEIREPQAPRTRAFMQTMRAWHTRLNFKPTPGQPTLGAQLNAAANTVFVFICLTGLVLWWPRTWNARVLRPALWFVRSARGKARDWNWHNVLGFWTLPALFIMAVSGVVLSYRWAGDLVFRMAGEKPPAPMARPAGAPGAARAEPVMTAPRQPAPVQVPEAFLTQVMQKFPRWEQISVRPGTGGGASAVVRSAGQWPPFSSTNISSDPKSGELRVIDAYGSLSAGTRARRWMRVLHTGEAFRWPGQLIAGLGCLAACVLVWTGVALAWRRFFGRKESAATVA